MPLDGSFFNCQTKDWWTYEFCYGRHIQQYHMEGDLFLDFFSQAFTVMCGRGPPFPPSLLPSRPHNENNVLSRGFSYRLRDQR